jgi:hypothetical protein
MDSVDLETPLSKWMRESHVSAYEVAKRARISYKQVCKLRDGESLPSLVSAFRIDQATKGGVPPVAWLATPLGRKAWAEDHNWERWMEQRREEQKRNRARSEEVKAQKLEVAALSPAPAV